MSSPTELSLALLREEGYETEIVEKFIRAGRIQFRKDFKGFGDILAWQPGRPDIMVQTTTMSNRINHIDKIRDTDKIRNNLIKWLNCSHHEFVFHFWRKLGPRGKRKTWKVSVEPLRVADLTHENPIV